MLSSDGKLCFRNLSTKSQRSCYVPLNCFISQFEAMRGDYSHSVPIVTLDLSQTESIVVCLS